MKKYILKQSGKEVKVGDTIEMVQPVETIFGKTSITQDVEVDEEKLEILIKNRLVEVKEEEEDLLKPYIRKLARKMGFPFFGAVAFFQSLTEVSAFAAYQLLLLYISKDFNKGKDLKDFAILSVIGVNGHVMSVRNECLNYAHIPVFTTEADAQKAIKILKSLHEFLYEEQENH